ncbi:heterokaryon incompatibility protein [Colletotrichum kahawae]|uniref:Heterokaryon incompatibility protein n=1 Tax=Colletotrichum kahawae TaxID=34407 RepID=A0AAD9Y5K3_COLKA|nr:heterokaryon incompatibility protein [Colletotrichum kahawae]
MPYMKAPLKPQGRGFFGEVSCYEMHAAHIRFPGSSANTAKPPIKLAVKKANDNADLAKFFRKEAKNLNALKNNTTPNLIKPIAAYEFKGDKYLLFPWAEGGSLSNCWRCWKAGPLDPDGMEWIINQFRGIFLALGQLHDSNCRHGDLKPDNILWFKDARNKGELQIADLGLATFHQLDADTRKREELVIQTTTPTGTRRYQAPETDGEQYHHSNPPRSRSYDMWSMGCVMFELLIWLAYGNDDVETFQRSTPDFFWERVSTTLPKMYRINPVVEQCIDVMREDCPRNTVYGDLFELIVNQLLVFNSSNDQNPAGTHRLTAHKAEALLDQISRSLKDPRYIPLRSSRYPRLQRNGGLFPSDQSSQNKANYQELRSKFNDVWDSTPDEDLAAKLFKMIPWHRVRPRQGDDTNSLCDRCTAMKLAGPWAFQPGCVLCNLIRQALQQADMLLSPRLQLQQKNATIGVEKGPDLLSIYKPPGSILHEGAQEGLPMLTGQASREQFTLLREWIRSCDSDPSHEACRRSKYHDVTKAPTRLIDVGELRLVSSNSVSVSDYVALSHCWGKLEKHQRFCLYRDNINELQRSIEFERLPQNFMDAVIVTRGLGIKYLWIDSICIIQDDAQDWEVESSKMEEVFSCAYVTISAVSAKSSLAGFLGERPSRACVRFQADGKQPLYVCPAIDDFHRDVELGEISKRGWVLQERALSRRTIYYTSTQVYWECGAGVRCETLRRLYNSKSAFLGDANFPHSALNHYKDGRQMLIQDLYERYSALEFSYASDRAVAILGLQKRLARAFETRATYGLFATYLRRGLLWRRAQAEPMTIIAQPSGRHVPSWSWFSKMGAIKYMDLKFDSVKWTNDFESPFIGEASGGPMGFTGERTVSGAPVVRALAKDLKLSKDELVKNTIFDDRNDFEVHELLFVVIGRDKNENSMEVQSSHGLVIRRLIENLEEHDQETYVRVGVASLQSNQIMNGGSWVKVC